MTSIKRYFTILPKLHSEEELQEKKTKKRKDVTTQHIVKKRSKFIHIK